MQALPGRVKWRLRWFEQRGTKLFYYRPSSASSLSSLASSLLDSTEQRGEEEDDKESDEDDGLFEVNPLKKKSKGKLKKMNPSPQGFISLKKVSAIVGGRGNSSSKSEQDPKKSSSVEKKDYSLDLYTPGRIYYLLARTEEQYEYWLNGLKEWKRYLSCSALPQLNTVKFKRDPFINASATGVASSGGGGLATSIAASASAASAERALSDFSSSLLSSSSPLFASSSTPWNTTLSGSSSSNSALPFTSSPARLLRYLLSSSFSLSFSLVLFLSIQY